MSYCDYGAFVWKNGKRMRDYEDAECSIEEIGYVHGLIRDDRIEVLCYKQGLPVIFLDGKRVEGYEDCRDFIDYGVFSIEVGGYHITFRSGYEIEDPYEVDVICPNGDRWVCRYDYGYGAGFEEISLYDRLEIEIEKTKAELEEVLDEEGRSYLVGVLEGLEFAQKYSKMV